MSFVTSNFNVVVISNSTMHKNNGDLRSYVTPCKIGYFILSPAFFDEVPSKMKAICKMTKQNKQSPGFCCSSNSKAWRAIGCSKLLSYKTVIGGCHLIDVLMATEHRTVFDYSQTKQWNNFKIKEQTTDLTCMNWISKFLILV